MFYRLICNCALAFLAVCALEGCNKGVDPNAFRSAGPDSKVIWEKVQAAIKTDDYAAAFIGLRDLGTQPGLTDAQQLAMSEASKAVTEKMYAAADKGDEKAKKAMEEIRKAMGR